MYDQKQSLSTLQLFFLIVQTEIGITIFSLVNTVHESAKNDSWISMLIVGFAFEVLIIIYMLLHMRVPEENLFGMAAKVAGKYFGYFFNVLFILYFVGQALFTALSYVYISKAWLLPFTPWTVLYFIFIISGMYMASASLTTIARFCGFAMILIFILLISMLFAFPELQVKYILPIGTTPLPKLFEGAYNSVMAYTGISIALAALPRVKGSYKGKYKAASSAILFVTLTYTFIIVMCLMFFSGPAIDFTPEPVLMLLKSLTVFKVFERVDITLVSAWIVPMTTTYTTFLYLASKGITQISPMKNRTKVVIYMSILIFFLCILVPTSDVSMKLITTIAKPVSYTMMFAVPSLYLVLSFIRKTN